MFYGSLVVSLVPQYHNLCPSTLQKCPLWVEEVVRVQMTLLVVICVYLRSWSTRRRSSNPTGDVMMDLDPWRSPGVVEVVKESYEAPWHVKEVSYFIKNT